MRFFGLTGGLASGKSTVAARWRERGLPVIDADVLAREVVAPGTDGLRAVVEAFGEAILAPDGSLDRKALAARVFGDAAARKTLERITHPRIGALAAERGAALGARGEPLVAYEATLIVENGMTEAFRPLVVVACPEEVQVARAMARDGGAREAALARIRAQRSLADKVAVADVVVDSGGSLRDTCDWADAALREVCVRARVDAARYGVGEPTEP